MKRFLSLFLALIVAVGVCLSVPVTANAEGGANDYYYYATNINVNQEYTGFLDISRDYDYYKFTLTKFGYINLTFKHQDLYDALDYWKVRLYNSYGVEYEMEMAEWVIAGNQTTTVTQNIGLYPGTYFIEISDSQYYNSCDYKLEVNFNNSDYWECEENDDEGAANTIKLNTTYYGSIIPNHIKGTSDYDYYKFTLPKPGYINVDFSHKYIDDANSYWDVRLYDVNAYWDAPMDTWGIAGYNELTKTQNIGLPAGTYYLFVKSGACLDESDYSFKVNFTASDYWEREDNNYQTKADKINLGEVYYGSIITDNGFDEDFYSFTLSEAGKINIVFSHKDLKSANIYWRIDLYSYSSYSKLAAYYFAGNQPKTQTENIDLNAGEYYIIVKGGSSVDCRDDSDYSVCVTKALDIPVVKVANSGKGIKVKWNTIDNAEKYIIYSKTYNAKTKKWSGWKTRDTVTSTSWTDTSVKSGTKYVYTVKAVNGDVKSGIKSSSTILFLSQPTVKIANASTGVKVSWNKITGATGYKVYRAEYTNGKWSGWKSVKTIDKGSTVSWTDKSVKSGVKYKYTVKAVNGKTGSTYKSSSSLLYLAQPKVAVKALSNGIKVVWVQSTGATSYKIYRSEYNTKTKKWSSWKSIKTAKSTSKSYTDKTAKKGVKYRYAVKAVNGKVASTYKSSSSVKR